LVPARVPAAGNAPAEVKEWPRVTAVDPAGCAKSVFEGEVASHTRKARGASELPVPRPPRGNRLISVEEFDEESRDARGAAADAREDVEKVRPRSAAEKNW
jgi:hypothetical protein